MPYFVKITNCHSGKNKLQEYVSKQLAELECLTLDDPDAFKKHLDTTVHRANQKFPRCRPLIAYLHAPYKSGQYTAGVGEVIQFSLYAQRGVFVPDAVTKPASSGEGMQATLFTN